MVPLESIIHELDKYFLLGKGTVWKDIYVTYRVGHYTSEIFQCAT